MNENVPHALDPLAIIAGALADAGLAGDAAKAAHAAGKIVAALDQAGVAFSAKDAAAPVLNLAIARATKSNVAQDWKPTDAIAWMLAQMRAGRIDPQQIFICWNTAGGAHSFVCATQNKWAGLGMLEAVKHAFMHENKL